MSAYVSQLLAQVAAEQHRQEATSDADKQAARDRLSPLDDRVERLLTTIPIEVQREGLSLNALQRSLRGRRRGKCHPGELGAALRKLGYKRRRQWRGDDGFQALWYPMMN